MNTNLTKLEEQGFPNSLVNKLKTCIQQNQIYAIWFGTSYTSKAINGLWLHIASKETAVKIFCAESCKSYMQKNEIIIVLLDDDDLNYHRREGTPFIKLGLYKANLIFNDEDINLPSTHLFSSYVKEFKQRYLEKQALLATQYIAFNEADIPGCSYVFLKSFEYDIGVLERLLLGVKRESNNLTERISLLESIFPPIRSLFIKDPEGNFYLIDRIENDMEWALHNDWGEALEAIQKQLKNLVVALLNNMFDAVSLYGKSEKVEKNKLPRFEYRTHLKALLNSDKIEEIYKFHESVVFQNHNTIRYFYLLALIKEGATKEVQRIIDEIEEKKQNIRFVIITHTRFYIQRHLYMHRSFFKKILDPMNLIYSSGYYPSIHWERTYGDDYEENLYYLDHPLSSINKIIKSTINTAEPSLYISSKELYKCIYIKLQVYILFRIHYLPKTTNLNTLYHMALYAGNHDIELTKLFKELNASIFDFALKNKEVEMNNILLGAVKLRALQNFFKLIEV